MDLHLVRVHKHPQHMQKEMKHLVIDVVNSCYHRA